MDDGYAAWAARWRVSLGFVMGIVYLIFSQPTWVLLVSGGALALLGLLLRSFAAGHLEKDRKLATSGPYRFTRNPLYLGSFLMASGFAVAGGSLPLGLSILVLFLIVYGPVMRRETAFLRLRFQEAYGRYTKAVPLFIPNLSNVRKTFPPEERFRWERYRKNREYEAGLGYLAGVVFLALKVWLR